MHPLETKQPETHGCFDMAVEILCIEDGCLGKHSFVCLVSQALHIHSPFFGVFMKKTLAPQRGPSLYAKLWLLEVTTSRTTASNLPGSTDMQTSGRALPSVRRAAPGATCAKHHAGAGVVGGFSDSNHSGANKAAEHMALW